LFTPKGRVDGLPYPCLVLACNYGLYRFPKSTPAVKCQYVQWRFFKFGFGKFVQFLTGLPDGLFSNQKSKFGYILEGLALEDVGIFYGHLIHFRVFCYILWTLGRFRANLVYYSPLWYFVRRKIWQPWFSTALILDERMTIICLVQPFVSWAIARINSFAQSVLFHLVTQRYFNRLCFPVLICRYPKNVSKTIKTSACVFFFSSGNWYS
jgi:hypothetical protein